MKDILREHRINLLGLAFVASLLELGPIATILYRGEGIMAVLAAGLAYQIGNAAPRPVRTSRLIVGVALAIGAALLWAAPVTTPLWLFGIALLSWLLQVVRRKITAMESGRLPTTVQKRIARVVGFVVAALISMELWLLLLLLIVGNALHLIDRKAFSLVLDRTKIVHPIEWVMLVHQTHYFIYAYSVPVLVARQELGGVPLIGFWFACGWISYLSAETLWSRFSPRPVFIFGHLFLGTVLLLMTLTVETVWATAALWILSGFGGGTVYCLTLLHKREDLSHTSLEGAEDVGHLLGVALALGCVYFLNWDASLLPAVASVWAFVAAFTMTIMLFFTRRTHT